MINDIQTEIIDLERELTELKTAQTKPSNSQFFTGTAIFPAGSWSGSHKWTIQFEDVGDDTAPIAYTNSSNVVSLEPYDSATNSQKLEWYSESAWFASDQKFFIMASRPIASITFNG